MRGYWQLVHRRCVTRDWRRFGRGFRGLIVERGVIRLFDLERELLDVVVLFVLRNVQLFGAFANCTSSFHWILEMHVDRC